MPRATSIFRLPSVVLSGPPERFWRRRLTKEGALGAKERGAARCATASIYKHPQASIVSNCSTALVKNYAEESSLSLNSRPCQSNRAEVNRRLSRTPNKWSNSFRQLHPLLGERAGVRARLIPCNVITHEYRTPGVRLATALIAAAAVLALVPPAFSADDHLLRQHAFQRLQKAREKHSAQPRDPEAAWHLAQATYDLAEFATNKHERATLAQEGMDACTAGLAITNQAPLHYYLGMNQGQMARTKGLGGLKIVHEMEREFTVARALDEHFDYAGPDRCLGLLYNEAPTIGSIGSRSKARQHLKRALALAPDYPENPLDMVEAYWKWGDRRDAKAELTALESAWDHIHKAFSGPEWADYWPGWQARKEKISRKIAEAADSTR